MPRTKIAAVLGAAGITLTAVGGLSLATATPAQANGPCRYQVTHSPAYVRENPDTNSIIRTTKYAREMVTGPCRQRLDSESGVWFTAVDCGCASDLIGWMRTSQLD